MKHTRPEPLLSRRLLAFVRDRVPTAAEFIANFGEQEFHVLRKHGVFQFSGDRLVLNPDQLSPDKASFRWGMMRFHLDSDVIDIS